MATGRGINPKSVFSRTDPADAAQRIPVQATDGQDGYDIQTRRHWSVKVQNESDQIVAFRVLGFTFEDKALAFPVELEASANVAASENGFASGESQGIARLQVEIDPPAATVGDVTVVYGGDTEG